MAKMISLKSKATGLVGTYPEDHLLLDDDLVPVEPDEGKVAVKPTPEPDKVVSDKPVPNPESKDRK